MTAEDLNASDVPRAARTLFVSIPVWVLEHPAAQANRTLLHVYAAMYLDGDFGERKSKPVWEQIAARTGLQRSTIFRDVRAMVDGGLIRKMADGRYWMPMDDPCAKSTTVDSESTVVDRQSMAVDLQSTTVERTSLLENSESSKSARASAHIDELFAAAWQLYPRKRARDRALAAFRRRVAEGVDPEQLQSAARHFGAARAGHDRTFLPYGARFFGSHGDWVDWIDGDPDRRPQVQSADRGSASSAATLGRHLGLTEPDEGAAIDEIHAEFVDEDDRREALVSYRATASRRAA